VAAWKAFNGSHQNNHGLMSQTGSSTKTDSLFPCFHQAALKPRLSFSTQAPMLSKGTSCDVQQHTAVTPHHQLGAPAPAPAATSTMPDVLTAWIRKKQPTHATRHYVA